MEHKEDILSESLHVDAESQGHLRDMSKWARFIGLSGMIFCSIVVIISLALGGRVESALNSGFMRTGGAGFTVVFILLILSIAFFLLFFNLYRFANKMLLALYTLDKYEFVFAIKNLRNTYRFIGVLFTLLFLGSALNTFYKYL